MHPYCNQNCTFLLLAESIIFLHIISFLCSIFFVKFCNTLKLILDLPLKTVMPQKYVNFSDNCGSERHRLNKNNENYLLFLFIRKSENQSHRATRSRFSQKGRLKKVSKFQKNIDRELIGYLTGSGNINIASMVWFLQTDFKKQIEHRKRSSAITRVVKKRLCGNHW